MILDPCETVDTMSDKKARGGEEHMAWEVAWGSDKWGFVARVFEGGGGHKQGWEVPNEADCVKK